MSALEAYFASYEVEIPEGAFTVDDAAKRWKLSHTAAANRLNADAAVKDGKTATLRTAKRGNVRYYWPI